MLVLLQLVLVDLLCRPLDLPVAHHRLVHAAEPAPADLADYAVILLEIPVFHLDEFIPFNLHDINILILFLILALDNIGHFGLAQAGLLALRGPLLASRLPGFLVLLVALAQPVEIAGEGILGFELYRLDVLQRVYFLPPVLRSLALVMNRVVFQDLIRFVTVQLLAHLSLLEEFIMSQPWN